MISFWMCFTGAVLRKCSEQQLSFTAKDVPAFQLCFIRLRDRERSSAVGLLFPSAHKILLLN